MVSHVIWIMKLTILLCTDNMPTRNMLNKAKPLPTRARIMIIGMKFTIVEFQLLNWDENDSTQSYSSMWDNWTFSILFSRLSL